MKKSVLFLFALGFLAVSCEAPNEEVAEKETPFIWENANLYFLLTDRFNNGDTSNDVNFDRTKEPGTLRGFEGGDIKGITDHVSYISDMGFTAIWPCPLLTNDMPKSSYHGYAITDLYEIDPRFGTLEQYVELSSKASEKGVKLIMDQVANHCGLEHWWMKDLPFEDWVNYQAKFEALYGRQLDLQKGITKVRAFEQCGEQIAPPPRAPFQHRRIGLAHGGRHGPVIGIHRQNVSFRETGIAGHVEREGHAIFIGQTGPDTTIQSGVIDRRQIRTGKIRVLGDCIEPLCHGPVLGGGHKGQQGHQTSHEQCAHGNLRYQNRINK